MQSTNINSGLIVDRRSAPQFPHPYLRRDLDPRPKCAMIVGDGLTQGFLSDTNLIEKAPCRMCDLLPASGLLNYIPVEGDRFEIGPLWDRKKWPRLFDAWTNHRGTVTEFFASRASKRLNPDAKSGRITYSTSSLEYEIRAYLWHYFRSIALIYSRSRIDIQRWKWFGPFARMLSLYRTTFITFNYDTVLEQYLYTYSNSVFGLDTHIFHPFDDTCPALDSFPSHVYLVISVHGSYGFLPEASVIRDPNPWLSDHRFSGCYELGVGRRWNPAPSHFPAVPDLIPPGHAGDHMVNPSCTARIHAKAEIAKADLVVFCGLSGREPDTAEIVELIASIPSHTKVIHVGLDADRSTPVGSMLLATCESRYCFVRADQLDDLIRHLTGLNGAARS